ncbi:23S rRNA (guanosine(2251)-2'-O)-methyltransferase RlmB [Reyranella sp. CPCC 100927]|uniref:23S rRNA (guanosine(2251)-2'-O)-methyltransferase RlmB n=1 Tax=Reyranella sp. CPCC 100927 TaxID=2599616 RepID=UPI00351A7F1E
MLAALANPERRVFRLLLTQDAADRATSNLAGLAHPPPQAEIVPRERIAERVPAGAVHQGFLAAVAPLPDAALEDIMAAAGEQALVLALDQVTDPHNVGAILRSAEAFGAAGVVVTERHAPEETGTLAKAASGALERVPLVRVVNLSRALDQLKQAGFWVLGLDERAEQTLAGANVAGRLVLALGAEGEGLRRLTQERCDLTVRLPMKGAMPSLNVSNAAAISLYELSRKNEQTGT